MKNTNKMSKQNNENLIINQSDLKNELIILQPGVTLSDEFKESIKKMNAGNPSFEEYSKRVREVFLLDPVRIDEKSCYFLGGFIEGEGSFSVSVKRNDNLRFGIELDPLFNITQHINGVRTLYLALEMFKTGRIRYKTGSNATLVFIIEPRKSLQEKVCPFLERYVYPFSAPAKQARFRNFKLMLDLFDENAHLDKDRFINELLPIWDEMRMHRSYERQTFKNLEEAQDFVINFTGNKL